MHKAANDIAQNMFSVTVVTVLSWGGGVITVK